MKTINLVLPFAYHLNKWKNIVEDATTKRTAEQRRIVNCAIEFCCDQKFNDACVPVRRLVRNLDRGVSFFSERSKTYVVLMAT